MGVIRLCYGVSYAIEDWREALGMPNGAASEKKCPFCQNMSPIANNYCGACGYSIAGIGSELTDAEIIDISQETAGVPPVPLQVLVAHRSLFICQVLATGTNEAMFHRPVATFPWEKLGTLIVKYAASMGMPQESPRIIAFTEDPKEK